MHSLVCLLQPLERWTELLDTKDGDGFSSSKASSPVSSAQHSSSFFPTSPKTVTGLPRRRSTSSQTVSAANKVPRPWNAKWALKMSPMSSRTTRSGSEALCTLDLSYRRIHTHISRRLLSTAMAIARSRHSCTVYPHGRPLSPLP